MTIIYKCSDVAVRVAHYRAFTAQCPWVSSIAQNMQPFTCNGMSPSERKILELDKKPQIDKQTSFIYNGGPETLTLFAEIFILDLS